MLRFSVPETLRILLELAACDLLRLSLRPGAGTYDVTTRAPNRERHGDWVCAVGGDLDSQP